MNAPSPSTAIRSGRMSRIALALFFSAHLVSLPAGAVETRFDWMPAEAESDGLRSSDVSHTVLPVALTETPKPTADISKFTKVYTLELEKFGIRNDGTQAEVTSKGINAALQHAKTLGANRIVFPKGTYLINEKDPIILDHQNTVIDLNGATLQIQANGLPNYSVVQIIDGAKNLRLTNGTLRGDRDEHDYKAAPGTHEGGACLYVYGGENLEIDHLTLTKGSGDGVTASSTGSRNREELIKRILYSVPKRDIESGAFSEKGEKVESSEKVRSRQPYAFSQTVKKFELGHTGGYHGFPWIKSRTYQAYFYDGENRFLEKKECRQFRKVTVPEGTRYVHFEFNQPEIEANAAHAGASNEWLVRINTLTPPTDVHFHHNLMVENRRLGMANAGQRWLIEENRFERNGGTAPSYGVDFEDGGELMHDIVFRKNTFQGNRQGDLVVCAGSEILVEDNDFENKVVFHGRAYNYIVRNNRINGGAVSYATRTGIATIEGNQYRNCNLVTIEFDGKGVADGFVRKAGENVSTPALLLSGEKMDGVKIVRGTYLNFKKGVFNNTKFQVGDRTAFASFIGCTFENSQLDFLPKGGEVLVQMEQNTGELEITGAGSSRMKEK